MTSSADERVTYQAKGSVVWIYMDDGKANAVNAALMDGLLAALDRAEREKARAVVLAGRLGFFSGGLDLKTLPFLPADELKRVLLQFGDLTIRLLTFPRPIVALSAGHALAAGAVMLLCVDWRVGCQGTFKYGLNEVAINLPLPGLIVELARARLDPRWLHRAAGLGEVYGPEGGLAAGYLDELTEPAAVVAAAERAAARLADLPDPAYFDTKHKLRAPILEKGSRESLETDLAASLSLLGG